ncbi:porin-like protein [Ancylobacter aquaticus]|uniref:Porin-like protein n=1 Tax=Ancylobacter aquaticus TaxID=100 RepID=A0A4R1IG48_ANCAQ|nr:porin [Ancylobacter aquaticus]TCK30122.1 porin-like protein [Ancylobacter aquaticus]
MGSTAQRGTVSRHLGAIAALVAGVTALGTLPALAQASGPSGKADAAGVKSDPACASHGAGFARLPGSSTCVKISGSVQVDLYSSDMNSTSRVDALSPGLKSR